MKEKYFLEYAIEEKKLSQADLNRYERRLKEELSNLRGKLAELEEAMSGAKDRAVRAVRKIGNEVVAKTKKTRRKVKKASAEVMASRKLQGQYIAAIRTVPKNKRKKFADLAKEKGREAAIREIKKATAEL